MVVPKVQGGLLAVGEGLSAVGLRVGIGGWSGAQRIKRMRERCSFGRDLYLWCEDIYIMLMRKTLIIAFMLGATMVVGQESSIKGNSPELTAQMNGQMAKRNTAVFEENKGQMKDQHWQPRPDVLFNGSAQGMHYYIRGNGMSYQLSRVESWKEEESHRDMPGREKRQVPDEMGTYRVDVEWTDFNADFTVEKGKELDGYTNYYNVPEGVEPALFVKQYESVTLKGLWPGIDLRCYSTDGMLETDWLVAAGADYSKIRFEVKGAELLTDGEGHLIMSTPFGEIREGGLKVYQEGRQLEARWVIAPLIGKVTGGVVSFEVIGHDPMLAMRIDPVVRVWGTYYGGNQSDNGASVSLDNELNSYLCGNTSSSNNIATTGSFQQFFGGGSNDGFLTKYNSEGNILWSTYFGGENYDAAELCIAKNNDVVVMGFTGSPSGISTVGAHQYEYGGGTGDAFIAKFSEDGILHWGTYFGGTNSEYFLSGDIDAQGNIAIVGLSTSTNGISTIGSHQEMNGGSDDGIVVLFDQDGVRQWGSYFGGSSVDHAYGCAFDLMGNIIVAGTTASPNGIATPGAHQTTYSEPLFSSGNDAFLSKFSFNGSLLWGTYFGGVANDGCLSVCSDSNGNVIIGGVTSSVQAISTANGHQPNHGNPGTGEDQINFNDAFIAKFSATGTRLWSTYYGGNGSDWGTACITDVAGYVYLAGWTKSTNNIAFSNAHQISFGGNEDAFIAKFRPDGERVWGSYYGGANEDAAESIATDGFGHVVLAGRTSSTQDISTPLTNQASFGGGVADAFLAFFDDCSESYTAMIEVSCNSYTAPDGEIHTESGSIISVSESEFCDEIISIELTVINFETSIIQIAVGLSAEQGGVQYQWLSCDDGNFTSIVGETEQHYLPTQVGYYAVEVDQGFCIDTADCVLFDAVVGLTSDTDDEEIRVFPNPGNGLFTLVTSEGGAVRLTVTDISGREVHSESYTASAGTARNIDISKQPNGIYTLQIKTEKGDGGVRLVKE